MIILDIIILLIIFIIIIALPITIILLINKRHKLALWIKIVAPTSFILVASISTVLIYLSIYYHATSEVNTYLVSDAYVEVKQEKDYYLFDNKANKDKAIIFYGGAKVEEKSYAPLARTIANNGVDVFIVDMPFRMPLLDIYKADRIYQQHSNYKSVYLMGHSLGGTSISICLQKSKLDYKGIIFLASFPNSKLDNKYQCLSIYGSNDKILNMNAYNRRISYFPEGYTTKIIEGANHSYFGYYGNQIGDGASSLTREEVTTATCNYIINLINGSI